MSKHKRRTGPPCTRCTQPAAGAYLCTSCSGILEKVLAEIPALAADLNITRARQDRMRGQSVGTPTHSSTAPLWNERASKATRTMHTTLASEVHQLATALNQPTPADTIPALAGWLLARIDTIRHTERASTTLDTLDRVVKAARRAIDRPPDVVFGGPCDECGADLYAGGTAVWFTCRACGAVYGFEARRAWLLAATADSLVTAAEGSRALAGLIGRELSADTIRSWSKSGRLTAHGHHGDRPLYRIGDLVHLARTTPTRQRRPAVA